ncbi:MAG: 50S ribosomal protein L29 [Candidatus Marsarchaeota archaeon]|nr:50S ribosomal protein L29 [Candidatus Marsarchaeota archaeon]
MDKTMLYNEQVLVIKIKDIRALPTTTLKSRLDELSLELAIEKRKVASTGVSSKVVKTRELKKTIARINTILKERGAPQ